MLSRTLIYETMSSHISGILLSIRALIGDPAVVEEMFRSLFFLQITTTNASILDLVTRPCLIIVTGNGYGRHSLSESYMAEVLGIHNKGPIRRKIMLFQRVFSGGNLILFFFYIKRSPALFIDLYVTSNVTVRFNFPDSLLFSDIY